MKPKKILVLTYWSFKDPLIQTYTLPYVKIMASLLPKESKIYFITLEKNNLKLNEEEQIRARKELQTIGIEWMPHTYFPFGVSAMFFWIFFIARFLLFVVVNQISFVHCWCTPAASIGYLLSLFTNKKLVIDSYEPHAEAMVENGTWKKDSLAFKILFWLERLQSHKAHTIISATEGVRAYALEKYNATFRNFFVKPACVNLSLFSKNNLKRQDLLQDLGLSNKIVCVYAGKFGGIYLDKEVFDFLKACHNFWGDSFRALLLTSHSAKEIDSYCLQSRFDSSCVVRKFVSHHEIPDYMGLGDFALTPVKPVPTKRYCTPIKDGEYWALGLPVVIPQSISDDSDIIELYKAGAVLKGFDSKDYLIAIDTINQFLKRPRIEVYEQIRPLAEKYRNFEIAESVYRTIYT